MILIRLLNVLVLCLLFGLVSCSQSKRTPDGRPIGPDGRFALTYQEFKAADDYRYTRDVWYHDQRIASADAKNTVLHIDLANQRGTMWVNDEIAMDYPVSTGKSTHLTPRGTFSIIEKKEKYRSRSYGVVKNASGHVVNSDATSSSKIPAGGRFEGSSMPLWMRIHGGVGLHVGIVYRDAASHGCIRVPIEPCRILFDKCGMGTKVVVK